MLDAIKTFVSREFSAIWNLIRQIVELKQDATNCKVQIRIPQFLISDLDSLSITAMDCSPRLQPWDPSGHSFS